MNIIAEFMTSHTIVSILICIIVLALAGQIILWFSWLFYKSSYYFWLLRSSSIRDRCADEVEVYDLLLALYFGNPVKGIEYLAKHRAPRVEEALSETFSSSRSHNIRRAVCAALGDIGSVKAISLLIKQLLIEQFDYGGTKRAALEALLKLAHTHPEVSRSLTAALNGSERDAEIVSLLGRMGELDTLCSILPEGINKLVMI